MKILIISNLFHPDQYGGASIFTDLCRELCQRGHHVSVYTTYPYYPEWKNKSDANPWGIAREDIDGVHVERYGVFIPGNPSRLVSRIVFELSFPISLLRSLFRAKRYDVVMVFCPMMGAVVYAAARKLLFREPLWLNVQDIPADAAAASGISRSGVFNKGAQFVQRWLFNRADVWSSIAPGMVQRLESLRRRGQPVHLSPNWLHESLASLISSHREKVGRSPSTPIRLLYAGNIGRKQGLREFCEYLRTLDLQFHLRIHGNGGEAADTAQWVREAGDPRFSFGGFLEDADFVQAFYDTDVFLITERSGVGASFIPSKLIPCISTATPLFCICDRDGPLGQETLQHGLGVVVSWDDIDRVAPCLKELQDQPDAFVSLQRNAARRSEAYMRENVIRRLEAEMAALAAK